VKRVSAPPIIHRDEYTAAVEKELLAWFDEVFFTPIRDLIAPITRDNAQKPWEKKEHSAIWDALLAGTIWYAAGVFSGKFNAAISRELRALGARKITAGFALAQSEIPIVLRGAVTLSRVRAEEIHQAILTTLTAMEEHIAEAPTGLVFSNTVDGIVQDLQEQLVQSVSTVEGLPAPGPTPVDLSNTLREGLTEEANLEVKGFTAEQIQQLRSETQKNLDDGARTERLTEIVEARFGVSKRRARGIAENATSKLVSNFRKRRYRDLGSDDYDWETSRDEKVRKDHVALQGTRHAWSSPPITNRATGARNHPGEDHNCRCLARPRFVIPNE
jgi:SPP1 gp7 family putative phage head morphogenesis protein